MYIANTFVNKFVQCLKGAASSTTDGESCHILNLTVILFA